ncbi:hypothetical protein GCM10022281_12320 [Sphingomonas rosea]|uniref:MoaD/ThiS family protein n=1 Tax=Sphingomonas rosea TaxID=335605 RepID=A0ABP7U0C0_9SPHN
MTRVSFYGLLADAMGRHLEVEVPKGGVSLGGLRERLAAERLGMAGELSASRAKAWVRDTLAGEDDMIGPDDAVEFWPPVSGG